MSKDVRPILSLFVFKGYFTLFYETVEVKVVVKGIEALV